MISLSEMKPAILKVKGFGVVMHMCLEGMGEAKEEERGRREFEVWFQDDVSVFDVLRGGHWLTFFCDCVLDCYM